MSESTAPAVITPETPIEELRMADRQYWLEGPPHEEFERLRSQCPVHFTEAITEYPDEKGFWSVTLPDDIHTVSRDWQTFSSAQGFVGADNVIDVALQQAMFIGMDPPRHDRLKALFQKGFTPKRIDEHEDAIMAIADRVLDRLDGRAECDIVKDLAQPVVARVIGSFVGISEEDDLVWAELMNTLMGAGDDVLNPEGPEAIMERLIPEIFARCGALIAERRENPTDDLTSILVHAEVDGEQLEEHEIVMGFVLLMAAGNDSTKSTFCSALNSLLADDEQRQILLADMSLVPSAVEEALRMFPAFAHFRRTATKDTELHGTPIKQGEKVIMWYASSNRDETRFDDPHHFDVRRNPEHQAFGGGGRHFCLGPALARMELRILLEKTLTRYPEMQLAGKPRYSISPFANQLTSLPVRLGPRAA